MYIIFELTHLYRHEVAESLGLLSYSFGTEDIDRYVRVYTKIHMPCEDELAARRRGEPWNDEIKSQLIEKVKVLY